MLLHGYSYCSLIGPSIIKLLAKRKETCFSLNFTGVSQITVPITTPCYDNITKLDPYNIDMTPIVSGFY